MAIDKEVKVLLLYKNIDKAIDILKDTGMAPELNYVRPLFVQFSHHRLTDLILERLNDLANCGVAYNASWPDLDAFDGSDQYSRFSFSGELELFRIPHKKINPPLEHLMMRINDPDELQRYIIRHHKVVTPMDWFMQDYYEKIYLTKRLLTIT